MRETIHASLLEVVNAKRRLELIGLLSQPERFDFDAAETAWGGDKQWKTASLADTRGGFWPDAIPRS
ncbi:hypothetical protein [Candidatus Poriferisocius sp.]|uniref:hypothetical protein n=1 Tax=Candidatus Poriferisocius sp. TaxID=3101276 RepID=UPI003B015FA7